MKQRILTIKEILTTEEDYVKDLKTLLGFIPTIKAKKFLTADLMAQIFSNVEQLCGINEKINEDIRSEKNKIFNDGETDEKYLKIPLGSIFTKLGPFLKMYLQYCENHDNALIVLAKQKKKNKQFEQWMIQTAETPECRGLYLKDYLIKPIQRLCKYPLLFQNLLKVTPTSSSEHAILTKCLDTINQIVRNINEIRDNNVNFLSLFTYEEKIADLNGTLLSRQRKFIREGTFHMLEEKKTSSKILQMRRSDAQERVMLVFSDKILFCKKTTFALASKNQTLKYSFELINNDLKIMDNIREHPEYDVTFMMETHSDKKTRMIFCEHAKDKTTWMKLIQETVKAAKQIKMSKEDDTEITFSGATLPLDPAAMTEREVRELVSHLLGPKGITIKSRKVYLKTYKNCFLGKDLVAWLIDNKVAENTKKAEEIGRKIMLFNYMKHAEDKEEFYNDSTSPYRFHNVSMDLDKRRKSVGPQDKSISPTSKSVPHSPPPHALPERLQARTAAKQKKVNSQEETSEEPNDSGDMPMLLVPDHDQTSEVLSPSALRSEDQAFSTSEQPDSCTDRGAHAPGHAGPEAHSSPSEMQMQFQLHISENTHPGQHPGTHPGTHDIN
uniref:DH domain-containing protein n=1 Tax=Arcella intermedia TaxID=1963864 RepID=A0A6B2L044_9EUKA